MNHIQCQYCYGRGYYLFQDQWCRQKWKMMCPHCEVERNAQKKLRPPPVKVGDEFEEEFTG